MHFTFSILFLKTPPGSSASTSIRRGGVENNTLTIQISKNPRKFGLNLREILIYVVLLMNFTALQAQPKWELKKQEDGITVYTASISGSSFKAFRAVVTIQGTTLTETAAAVLDLSNYANIFPDTRECKLLKQHSDGHNVHYMRTAAPWPVDDRDGVYEIKSTYLKEQKTIKISITCIKSSEPVKSGVVRMQQGTGFWELKEIKPGVIEIAYQFHGEPGGNIPAWLANSSVVSIPFKTLENLRRFVKEGRYRDAKVDFLAGEPRRG